MIESLTFITGNPKKAEEVGYHLGYPLLHKKVDLSEIQSLNLAEIVEYKAKEAYKLVKTPVLVEDTSLRFLAFGNLPGPLIKWFLKELGNNGLCKVLNSYKDRSALAEVNFGFYDGRNFEIFSGSWKGSIAETPRGEEGFGWDPVFIPEGYTLTWGEMGADKQKQTSMRRIALKKLEEYLKEAK